ncbi:riboflavine-aldehyde-forming enzyme [Pholiota conissans]|uniref:Riboflavine-aldehyde-forming enzyme n=1 Tax=Pholiota conissans TaxID=109636 RepID=A0A9P5Z9Z1_9AGAR|nr:riboflavine-aldehyde-forming enzyme [Pholiota conissans]
METVNFITLSLTIHLNSSKCSATWFNVGLGSCGVVNVNSDFIVALSTVEMAGGASCGRQIRVNFIDQGRSVVATVRDTCPSCSQFSIDLSPAAFQALASLDVGRIQVEWDFI